MPGARGLLGRFGGNTIGNAAGIAAGGATQRVLEPVLQDVTNEAWSKHASVPPDAYALAEGVAQGQVDPRKASAWAAQQGIGAAQFAALVDIANTGPPLGAAQQAARRGTLTPEQYLRALNRQGIEPEWWKAMADLLHERLDPSVVGNAVQQGHLPNDGILPDPVTAGPPFDIPLTQVDIDPLAEFAAAGIDPQRAKVIANLSGLPPGDIELLHMWNRGLITEAAVEAGIREGHRKTKWIPAVKELRWSVLSAIQYVEARVRGWIDDNAMYAGGALTGYRQPEMDLLFKIHGRPLVHNQVFIGLLRGGIYDGPTDHIDPAFLKSLQESNIRPEWYNLVWAQRYHYPSFFQVANALNKGWIDAETATRWLTIQAYAPDAVQAIIEGVTGTPSGAPKPAASPHVRSAVTRLYTALHTGFVNGNLDAGYVRSTLEAQGEPAATVEQVLTAWQREKDAAAHAATASSGAGS